MSDHTEQTIHIETPRPVRTRGPYAKRSGPKTVAARKALIRKAEKERTQADIAQPTVGFMQPPPSRMPRDTEAFQPDYDGPKERTSRLDRDTNQFELPQTLSRKLRMNGWDATWKVVTVLNQPVDGTELLTAGNAGWRQAKAKDFPELVPQGTASDATIERFGQRLYIRPLAMTQKAQQEDYAFANAQMQSRMAASQEGKMVRSDEEGLADMGRVVRPVAIKLEMEGESGTHGAR